jgi:DNA-binding PadR family transcriptional regulator
MFHIKQHHAHRHSHDDFARGDTSQEGRRGRHGHRHEHGHGRGRSRVFDYGELRLVILALIAERPRHGYEIIKAIEDRLGGAYVPSPGVVYPSLSMLEDLGHVAVAAAEGGRKLHTITDAGRAWLESNAPALKAVFARMDEVSHAPNNNPPPAILRAMENVKLALRMRLSERAVTPEEADNIAAALDAAATHISRN